MADLLVFAPHPDDAEIHCGATIAAHVRLGRSVAVVDATRGETATQGTPSERALEAAAAALALGLSARENLGLPDGGVFDGPEARLAVTAAIRRHAPRTVLCLAEHARHPDHRALAGIVRSAAKTAALNGFRLASGLAATPMPRLWFCEAELPLGRADLLVPCTEEDWERKRAAIRCYRSQIERREGAPPTGITDPAFLPWVEARGRTWGRHAGAAYAEAFSGPEAPLCPDLTAC